jgi:isopenicillin N synthase-like dioxygenase
MQLAALSTAGYRHPVPLPSIPTIDLASPDAATQIVHAYSTAGFAYLTNHGVDPSLVAAVFAESQRFHASPPEQKQSIALDRNHRGFIAINTSTDRNSTLADVKKPNQSESFMMMREDDPVGEQVAAGHYLAGPNQWPDWLPGFRDVLTRYHDTMVGVGLQLVELIAAGLGDADRLLAGSFEPPTTWLRLLHYPPCPPTAPDDLYGSAPHCDFGFITILAQDDVGGLQVMSPAGEWLDVPPVDGAFVMNVGEMLHRWSNGRLRSTPHRVINRSGRERYSCPFFFDPHVGTVIAPLPSTIGDEGVQYAPTHFGDFLRAELTKGYQRHARSTIGSVTLGADRDDNLLSTDEPWNAN